MLLWKLVVVFAVGPAQIGWGKGTFAVAMGQRRQLITVQVLHIKSTDNSIFNICEPRTQVALQARTQGSFIETPLGAAIE